MMRRTTAPTRAPVSPTRAWRSQYAALEASSTFLSQAFLILRIFASVVLRSSHRHRSPRVSIAYITTRTSTSTSSWTTSSSTSTSGSGGGSPAVPGSTSISSPRARRG